MSTPERASLFVSPPELVRSRSREFFFSLGAVQQQQQQQLSWEIVVYRRATRAWPRITACIWNIVDRTFSRREVISLPGPVGCAMTDIRIEEDDGTPITTAFVYTTDIVHVFGQHNGRFCHHIISAESPSIRRVRGPPSENFDVLTAVYCSRRNVIFTTNTVLNSGAVPFLCKIMEFCCDSGSWREVALVQNVRKIALSMVFKGQYLVMFVKRLHDYLVSVLVFDLVTRRLATIPLEKDMCHVPASFVDDEKSSSRKQTEIFLGGFYGHDEGAPDLPLTLRAMCVVFLVGPPSLHLFSYDNEHMQWDLRALGKDILAAFKDVSRVGKEFDEKSKLITLRSI